MRAQEIDPTKTLTIGSGSIAPVTISYAVNATVGEMIQAINAESDQTNVRAEWFGETGIALTNTAGHEGENIILGLVGGGSGLTSLGLVSGNYEGTYQISATGEEVVSNVFSTTSQALNNGATFDLTVTRSGGGATTVTIAAGSDTPQGIVDAINDVATGIPGITAALLADDAGGYRITLRDTTGVGNAFTVSSDIADYYPNDYAGNPVAAPDTDLGFNDLANRKTGINRPTEISLTLSGTGSPADLGRMALDTGVLIDGPAADDLAIFVTGSGTVDATLRADAKPDSVPPTFPAAPFRVDFSSNSVYTITDTATDTVVATRLYTTGADIEYQGIRVQFNNVPKSGDTYTIEANTDGLGSNENILRMIELGRAPLIAGQTFSAAYRDLVAGAGSRAQLAELGREAMMVVRDQAQASRESAVGVNLDEEAANLIRFQQAYQAAAQVIQMSQRLFDTLIQAS